MCPKAKQAPRLSARLTQYQLKQPPPLHSWKLCNSWILPTRSNPSPRNRQQMRLQLPPQAFSTLTLEFLQLPDRILSQSCRGMSPDTDDSWHHHYLLRPASSSTTIVPSPVARLASYAKSVAFSPAGSQIPVISPSSTSTPCPTSSATRKKRHPKAKKTR